MAEIGSIFRGIIEIVYLPSILDGDNWVMGDGLWIRVVNQNDHSATKIG